MFNKISEKEFEKKLNILKNEVDAVMYHLYTELAIHAIATKDKQVLSKLNLTPIFWNTTLNSLQTSIFITLGRIFDPEPSHYTITTLISVIDNNKEFFTKESFLKRSPHLDSYKEEYLKNAYFLTNEDFRKFKKHINELRKTYVENYQPIRVHFAHKKYIENQEVGLLFESVQIKQLQKFCISLKNSYEAIWQLYFNSRGPLLPIKSGKYSTVSIIKNKYYKQFGPNDMNVQIVEQVQTVMNLLKSADLAKY